MQVWAFTLNTKLTNRSVCSGECGCPTKVKTKRRRLTPDLWVSGLCRSNPNLRAFVACHQTYPKDNPSGSTPRQSEKQPTVGLDARSSFDDDRIFKLKKLHQLDRSQNIPSLGARTNGESQKSWNSSKVLLGSSASRNNGSVGVGVCNFHHNVIVLKRTLGYDYGDVIPKLHTPGS